jgi:O-antigen ligase
MAASAALRESALQRHGWILLAAGLILGAAAAGAGLAVGELDALYTTLALALCIGTLIDFRIGVVALLLILPFSRSIYFPHSLLGINGLNPLNVMLAGTLLAWLLRGGGPRGFSGFLPAPLLWLFILPIAIAAMIGLPHVDQIPSYLFEGDNHVGAYIRDQVKPLLIVAAALMVGAAVATSQKPERFLVPIVLAMWPLALLEIGFFIASGASLAVVSGRDERAFFEPLGLHSNELGRFHMVAYAFLLFCWWETKSPGLRRLLLVTLGLIVVALLLTFSRAAFLGFLLTSALFMLWKFNRKTLSLAMLATALAMLFLPVYFYERATTGFGEGLNSLTAGRLDGIWLPLLPELAKSPIWGNGLSSLKWSEPMRLGAMLPVGHAHNAYLEALLDMGIVGLVLLLAFYRYVWKHFRLLSSNLQLSPELRGYFQGGTAALAAFLATGMSGSSLRPDGEFSYLWVAIGVLLGLLARKPAA